MGSKGSRGISGYNLQGWGRGAVVDKRDHVCNPRQEAVTTQLQNSLPGLYYESL